MSRFEILCVTMHQTDFSKLKEMNIHSDVVFANQAGSTSYEELSFEGHTAKMITTATRGVGINRNLALTYASADICLFADDDVTYIDDVEKIVLAEFDAHPDADVFIFNLDTDGARKQIKYAKTKRCGRFSRMPWGAVRIAVRTSAVRKANLWFTTLFGGGCLFPSGEDSMWLADAKRKGLTFYVSNKTIGQISFDQSSWFTGYDEKFFFGKGACIAAMKKRFCGIWSLYYLWRYRRVGELAVSAKLRWIKKGIRGFKTLQGYEHFPK